MLNNPNPNQVPNLEKKSSAARQSLMERPQEIAEDNLISLRPVSDLSSIEKLVSEPSNIEKLLNEPSNTEKLAGEPSNTEKLVSDPSNTEKPFIEPSNTENNLSTPIVANERASESLATVEVN